MQLLWGCFIYLVLAGLITETSALPPDWTGQQTSFTLDASEYAAGDLVTFLSASSTIGDPVEYTLVSQTPDGGFSVSFHDDASQYQLTGASITESSYTVVVRAHYGNPSEVFSDLTITISVTGLTPVTGPTCPQGTSLTLDTSDPTSFNNVASLTCTSSDGTNVSYSVTSQTPAAGFAMSGDTLTCDQALITETTYTVIVTATNSGNSGTTDLTFTITASAGSDSSGASGTDQQIPSSRDNQAGTIAGGVAGVVGWGALFACLCYPIYTKFFKPPVKVAPLTCSKSSKYPVNSTEVRGFKPPVKVASSPSSKDPPAVNSAEGSDDREDSKAEAKKTR